MKPKTDPNTGEEVKVKAKISTKRSPSQHYLIY